MPEEKWVPLLILTVTVIVIFLQGRKLCKQVFTVSSEHDLGSFIDSSCATLHVSWMDTPWNVSAGKLVAGRKLFSHSCCPLFLPCKSPRARAKLEPQCCHFNLPFKMPACLSCLLSKCPLAGAWRMEESVRLHGQASSGWIWSLGL